MPVTKTAIVNDSQLALGQEMITDIADASDPFAVKLNAVFDLKLSNLLCRNWYFNRKRAQLTKLYKLTVVAEPQDDPWVTGDGLTSTSGVTCTVVEALSATEYLVTEPSDDFVAAEIISNGTDTAVYSTDTDEPNDFGKWDYRYQLPTDCIHIRSLVDEYDDKKKLPYEQEGEYLLTNEDEAYLLYNYDLTDVTLLPGWFRKLLSCEIAYSLSTKFVGNDQYIALRSQRDLKEAWDDALSLNGKQCYFEDGQGEYDGNTDVYEGLHTDILD